ncbi:glycosyltransferase [Candidatus Pacearchaeota archaeon]|nr:glycosyltransferase [Candidatus Pacearchaeota archaeon]
MTWVDIVFFFYTFVALYMLSLFMFIYFPNRKKLFDYPKGKAEPVSVIVPCYNEAETIGNVIKSLLELNYPKEMIEIIVVDDRSKDNSAEVVRRYAKKYKNVRLIVNERNSGGAAEPTNIGIKAAKYDYIAIADADSTPDKDALIRMIGFLQVDEKVGGVTCAVLARKPEKFMQKLQEIEYYIIGFNRKLLDLVDAIYVTPGPFALYKKKILFEIGLFDTKNMTQDIEIVWRMRANGYTVRMCLPAKVYSNTPSRISDWWRQRIRWNIGGAQCIVKYKKLLFKKGMLGAFIIPFFSLSLFIGLFGLGLFIYLLLRRIAISYLSTKYSIYASTAVVRLQDLSFTPSVLNFFGITLFFLGLGFTFLVLNTFSERRVRRGLINILFYSTIYLTLYPVIMVSALYKLARRKYSW